MPAVMSLSLFHNTLPSIAKSFDPSQTLFFPSNIHSLTSYVPRSTFPQQPQQIQAALIPKQPLILLQLPPENEHALAIAATREFLHLRALYRLQTLRCFPLREYDVHL